MPPKQAKLAVGFLAHDWAVSTGAGSEFGFDGFDGSGSTNSDSIGSGFDGFRFARPPARTFRFFSGGGAGTGRFRRVGSPLRELPSRQLPSTSSEDRVVAGRHLDEDDRPEQGEADQGDRNDAAAQQPGAAALGTEPALSLALALLLFDRIHARGSLVGEAS